MINASVQNSLTVIKNDPDLCFLFPKKTAGYLVLANGML